MSSKSPSSKRSNPSSRQNDKSGVKVNRAQVRAMEARAASTRHEQFSLEEGSPEFDAVVERRSGAASLMAARRKPVARPVLLTRAQEYAFIRGDMRRLIITASALFVLMVIFLFVFD